ncbi:hypothetical protein DEU56DRAFT_913528 [Suillus clintonianus]|uniref:uncharacterized protein n=1 Tax=Suillus clintonianus TaxID=1904413 RepID=UPI001B874D1C|nr:uncharacterized protein DEU56DRAFT_913528 [Suillus clintonianus]KAG2135162.1 hypothetical protein DEU56DRAFT_913528 [Suillus clintonianus]
MVGRTARAVCGASNVDTASFTSSRPTSPPDGEDEEYQPVVNPVSVPPIAGADSCSYDPSDATTPDLIPDGSTYDNVSSATPPEQSPELLTRSLPSTIALPLLHPALQDFILPKQNADGRCSSAAKGKGKVLPEEQPFPGKGPADLQFLEALDDEDLLYPPDFSSTEEWVAHTRPILQDYANRQIPLPLGRRVNVSLNEPSQFIQGALQLLANRDHPKNPPVEPSRQLGPQLLENFTDVHRWATEYFRARFGMSTVGSDIPVLLTIITNTFYEAHTQLIDSIADAALDNMRVRGAASLEIEDFAFGYDFDISQDLPFAVEASSRIYDTLERHRPRSPLELPADLPVTTRSGRRVKPSMQAQAAVLAESEKLSDARQRKKEKAKKEQESATSRLKGSKAVSQKSTNSAGVVVCTPSASIYHTPNSGILRNMETNAVVFAGSKCPTCSRVMPPRILRTPANPHSSSPSEVSTNISVDWSSERVTTGPAVSSNSRLALVTGFPPSTSHASSGLTNTTATLSEATTGTQDSVQAQAAPARGGHIFLRARGSRGNTAGGRGRGGGGKSSAPLTITIPARPRPVAPTADPTASASTAPIAPANAVRSGTLGGSGGGTGTAFAEARAPTASVRPGSVNTGGGGTDPKSAVFAFTHAYYSQYRANQSAPANTADHPSRGRPVDFSDPEHWIACARSAVDLPGFAAQVPERPAVAASSNEAHTTLASISQVDNRQSKKRKLGASK